MLDVQDISREEDSISFIIDPEKKVVSGIIKRDGNRSMSEERQSSF